MKYWKTKVCFFLITLFLASGILPAYADGDAVFSWDGWDISSEQGKVFELPWYLTLVNSTHAIPESYSFELKELNKGQSIDSRIYDALYNMFLDCANAGLKPKVNCSYRTYEDQKNMLISKYRGYRDQGLSKKKAQAAALEVCAYPGYSEHQIGLAVDIISSNKKVCSNEDVWNWMKLHCDEYGFIWRYPASKTKITGISNEDWHFRYVGVEAATYIMENQLCLEEYLELTYGYT